MTVLDHAAELVNGPRATTYGDARSNHAAIAQIWTVILDTPVTPEQVALCMAGVKVARLAGGLHRGQGVHTDSLIDLAGYAAVLELIAQAGAE